MTDLLPDFDSKGDTGVDSDRGSASMPRWVKVFGNIVIVLILLMAIIMLTGIGGNTARVVIFALRILVVIHRL